MEKVILIARKEIGYVSKQTRDNLYDHSADAGRNGFSKYFIDLFPEEFHRPWCMAFIIWIFVRAYGSKSAQKMLYMNPNLVWSCSDAARNFRKSNHWYRKTPAAGRLIFFRIQRWISHVGLITEVGDSEITVVSGNVMDESGIGHVVEEKISFNDIRIAGYGEPDYSIIKD